MFSEAHFFLHGKVPGGLVLVDDEGWVSFVFAAAVLIEEQCDALRGAFFPEVRVVVADVFAGAI